MENIQGAERKWLRYNIEYDHLKIAEDYERGFSVLSHEAVGRALGWLDRNGYIADVGKVISVSDIGPFPCTGNTLVRGIEVLVLAVPKKRSHGKDYKAVERKYRRPANAKGYVW